MKDNEVNNYDLLPSIAEIEQIIAEIKDTDLSKVSFNKLFRKIQSLQFIAFPTAILNEGYHIERSRINKPDEIFYSEKDISYRTDFENITKYGRANTISNSLFYGSFQSETIEHPRFVNLLETSEIFRNLEANELTDADFVMTVGKWKIMTNIEVVEVVFDEDCIKNSKEVEKAFTYHLEKLKAEHPKHVDQFELILRFFSNEFAKKDINSHYDYMISAIYSFLAIDMGRHKGIKYQSVKADYKGNNIVLTPTVTENSLKLEVAAMFRVVKNQKETVIIPIKICTDFGTMNTNFTWKDIEQKAIQL